MINYQKVWANLDLDEKMAFRDMTIKVVQEIYPHYIARPWEPTEADFFLSATSRTMFASRCRCAICLRGFR